MTISERIYRHPIIFFLGTLLTGFGAGIKTSDWFEDKSKNNFDNLAKGTYITNQDLAEKYILKADYEEAKAQIKTLQSIIDENKLSEMRVNDESVDQIQKIIRHIEIFPGDTVDYFGIQSFTSTTWNDRLEKVRDYLKNKGFHNTEIFKSEKNNYHVISYGYAWVGKAMYKVQNNISNASKPLGINKVEIVDLTTLASNGFEKYSDQSKINYFKPK